MVHGRHTLLCVRRAWGEGRLLMYAQLMMVTQALLACVNDEDYVSSGLSLLVELFDADDCLWVDVDLTPGSIGTLSRVRVAVGDARVGLPSDLVADHPA